MATRIYQTGKSRDAPEADEDAAFYDEQAHLAEVSRQVHRAAEAKLAALEPFTIKDQATGEERSMDDPEVRRWVMAERPEAYQRWLAVLELAQKIEREKRIERAHSKREERRAELEEEFFVHRKKLERGEKRAALQVNHRAEVARYKREKRRERFEKGQELKLEGKKTKRAATVKTHVESVNSARARKAESNAALAGKMREHTEHAKQSAELNAELRSADRKEKIERLQEADEDLERRLQEKEMMGRIKSQRSGVCGSSSRRDSQQQGSSDENGGSGAAAAAAAASTDGNGMNMDKSTWFVKPQKQQQKQKQRRGNDPSSSSSMKASVRFASSVRSGGSGSGSEASGGGGFGNGPAGATSTFSKLFSESTGNAALLREAEKGYFDARGTWHELTEDEKDFYREEQKRRAKTKVEKTFKGLYSKHKSAESQDDEPKTPSRKALGKNGSPSGLMSGSSLSPSAAAASNNNNIIIIRAETAPSSSNENKKYQQSATIKRLTSPKRSRLQIIADVKVHADRISEIAKRKRALHQQYAMFGTTTTRSLAQLSEDAQKRRDRLREKRCEQLEEAPVRHKETMEEAERRRAEYVERVREQTVEFRERFHPPPLGSSNSSEEDDDDGGGGEDGDADAAVTNGGDSEQQPAARAAERNNNNNDGNDDHDDADDDDHDDVRSNGKPKVWQTETGEFGYKVLTMAELRERREEQRAKHAALQHQALVKNAQLVQSFRVETLRKQKDQLADADEVREAEAQLLQRRLAAKREHREKVHQAAVKQFNESKQQQLQPYDSLLKEPSFIQLYDTSSVFGGRLSSDADAADISSSAAALAAANQSVASANALDADGEDLAEIQRQQQQAKQKVSPPRTLRPHFAEPFHRVTDPDEARRLYGGEPKQTAPMAPKPSTLPREQQNKILVRAKEKMEKQEQGRLERMVNQSYHDIGGPSPSALSPPSPHRRSASPAKHRNQHPQNDLNPQEDLTASYTDTAQYKRARHAADGRRDKTLTRLETAQRRREWWAKQRKLYRKQLHAHQEQLQEKRDEHVERHYAQLAAKADTTAKKVAQGLQSAEERRAEHLQERAARARVIGTEMNELARKEREVLEVLEGERREREEEARQKRIEEEKAAAEAEEAAAQAEIQRRKSLVLSGQKPLVPAAGGPGGTNSNDSFGSSLAKTPAVVALKVPVPPPTKKKEIVTAEERRRQKVAEEEQRQERMSTLLEGALSKSRSSPDRKVFLPPVSPVVVHGAVAQSAREEEYAKERRSRLLQQQLNSKLQEQEMAVASHLAASFEQSRAAKHQGAPSFSVRPPPTARKSGVADLSAPPRFVVEQTTVKSVFGGNKKK